MALDFGKLNFSTSFSPTSAFPLDARSYFESYADALAAAQTAVAAGSAESRYYFGQTLVVVEGGVATFYIIQPNRTLSSIVGSDGSSSITVNPDLFEYDESGNLSLIGFNEAEVGTFFTKGADGALHWVKPIDAYTKIETDEKIAEAVASAAHLKRKIVADLDEAKEYMANNADADQYIFMVPTGLEEADDKYDEYVVIVVAETPVLEKVGSWEVDLSEYAKTEDVNNALDGKVDVVEGYGLASKEQLDKIDALKDTFIEAVDEHFFAVEDKVLLLVDVPVSKVTGLQELLNSKVDVQEGYTLLSPTDKAKLDALVIGSDGDLELSGTVNAENVVNLAEWINEHASNTVGLSENNLTDELYNKLVSALFISSVDPNELDVTDGQLSIIEVDSSKVTGLQDALNSKVNLTDYNDTVEAVRSLAEMLNEHSTTLEEHSSDIQALWNAVTWQDII